MKRFIVIAYDIEDDRRRRQVAKLLEGCGVRVNKSVFECLLSDTQLDRLKSRLGRQVKTGDSLLYYTLCRSCIEKVQRKGAVGLPTEIVVTV